MVEVLDALLDLRKWERDRLELVQSYIPYDILLAVMAGHAKNAPLSVKELLASLPHSSTGVRYHLKRLIEDGWLETRAGIPSDARVRLVHPTEKLTSAFGEYVGDRLSSLAGKFRASH